MKPRHVLLFLGLVIFPTALLSLLAGRALRNWELVVLQRLEVSAAENIHSVSERLRSRLQSDLEHVRSAMAEAVADGTRPPELAATADRLADAHPEIAECYLFMNPWGFLHPESGGEGGDSGSEHDALIEVLRKEIASASAGEMICAGLGNVSYCFAPLGDRKLLYAGFRVDTVELQRLLAAILAAASDEKVMLRAEGPGMMVQPVGSPRRNEIQVGDPLGERGINANGTGKPRRFPETARMLAAERLLPPFDYVNILAFVRNPGELMSSGAIRVRLYLWAVAILAAGIVVGGWIIMREAMMEVRRARARSDFVIGVSHDLRTPIASVKILAESLHKGRVSDPDKQKKFCAVIVRESERLSQLVERVLFFVRFGQDALQYDFSEIDVKSALESAVRVFLARFDALEQKGESCSPEIRCEIRGDLPPVSADERALTQLMLNLLDNAVKYARPGSEASVCLSASVQRRKRRAWSREGEWVRIDVRDEGVGIRRADLKRVFRRFYRVPETAGDNVSGVGLGLALCRHVAEAHGGWIEAHSTVGKGSTFSVYLPIKCK